MLTIQIVSDLHIEYNNDAPVDPLHFITPSADVLIMAGDIGSLYKYDQLHSFIKGIVPYFKHVLYVPGNHEYYLPPKYEPKSIDQLKQVLQNLQDSFVNLTVLDQNSVQIEDICIAGATLWSDLKCELPRFVRAPHMTTAIYKAHFQSDLEYITSMIDYCSENKLKLVCVTHHVPTFQATGDRFKNDRYNSLKSSNLDYLLHKDKVDTWICGHVHYNFDFETENGCRVVGNQHGKPKDNIQDFRKDFVIKF